MATLTGTLAFPNCTINVGDELTLQFPRRGNIFDLDYTGQDGTLETIASKYDYAIAKITVKSVDVSGNNCSNIMPTTNPVAFENQQAIVRFTLQDESGNAICPTELTVKPFIDIGVKYSGAAELNWVTFGTLTITPSGSTNVVYVALHGVENKNLTLTDTVGNDTYEYTKSGVTFEHGKFYVVTVKMKKIQ